MVSKQEGGIDEASVVKSSCFFVATWLLGVIIRGKGPSALGKLYGPMVSIFGKLRSQRNSDLRDCRVHESEGYGSVGR